MLYRCGFCDLLKLYNSSLCEEEIIPETQIAGNYAGCGVFRYVTVSFSIKSEVNLLLSRYALFWRKLISWVCQAAMRERRAMGSCYHSQVRHADKLMTAESSQDLCAPYMHMRACLCVCVSPAWRQKFVNGFRDCRHTQDSSRFQTTSDKTGRRERLCAKAIHSALSTGAVFHRIKAPLFRNTLLYSSDIWRIFRSSGDMQLWDADVQ